MSDSGAAGNTGAVASVAERHVGRVLEDREAQAIRLPPEFRFGTDRVAIRRDGANLVVSPLYEDWEDYLREAPRATDDLLEATAELRRESTPLEERETLD